MIRCYSGGKKGQWTEESKKGGGKMKTVSRGIVSIIVCAILIVSFSATVSAEDEVFVVSADQNGDANYMVRLSNETGEFSSQENIMNNSLTTTYSYGNGIGDFDNDGNFDYIMGDGIEGGDIILFKKIGSGNQFASPVVVAGWSSGFFPMDMAVADFNEDGNFDFVMSYYFSSDCGLYLGDGALGFTGPDTAATDHLLLKNAAPYYGAGADAADFNNDGHADFVIAPYPIGSSPSEPFFVNLGNGLGNFTTLTFEGVKDANGKNVPYYGVAAADFDSDGNMDIAATFYDYLDIYKGNGDGTFEWLASYEYDLNLSPLDNYDFNGDGNQDLVAANFGLDGADVAILLGNGDGSFGDPAIYGGGTMGVRFAVSAPPSPIGSNINNIKPIAVVDPIHIEVTVGEEIVFDGSASYDDDGEIVRYEWDFGDGTGIASPMSVPASMPDPNTWDFGDGTGIAGATNAFSLLKSDVNNEHVNPGPDVNNEHVNPGPSAPSPSHSFYEAGKYKVRLTVTDDKGATGSVQAEVSALPVAARIKFRPYTLYLNSRAKWIWATIRLPSDFDARKIDDPSVCLVLEDGSRIYAYSNYGSGFLAKIRKRLYRKRRALTIRFDRQDLIQKIKIPSENITLMVQGIVLDNGAWVGFEGSGKIRTIEKKKKHNFFSKYWKRCFKRYSKKYRSNHRR
jgi:hypothetical protein